jgi:PTH2 family peptidyl-tRNA hydrolase
MKEIKQVIVVRKDLNLRKSELAAQVATASMGFLLDNNESKRADEINVKLSNEEARWINESFTKVVVGVDSEDALQDLIFKAEIEGIGFYPVVSTTPRGNSTICVAFGPDQSSLVDQVTGHLRLL